ncbi:hypothetical protein [Nitrosomonas aestuarii]|uniref:hypothetical protein n=1 Tax=Nitrosomonas aestuarii TaxID=52441 RepID=UPI000D30926D|nr:hypothetical protein [Nitrosomonas aestuarii]PTN10891.1 hypothetical protein C8R11_11769 [Nitrosomonas aestuarii]
MSTKGTDVATIIGKGLLGAIPFVGPLAAEIIGAVIPNQRIDRIESLLKLLESKIPKEDREKVEQRIVSPESVDLVEDSFVQASRALSEDRKEYIASLLKNSLTDDELKHIEYKRLLSILGELNDLEVLILKSQTLHRGQPEHDEFWSAHEDALKQPLAHMGSTQVEIDKHTIYQTHKLHLANLGLLKARFKIPKRNEFPEFDEKTGMIKAQGYDITGLGRLLLRSIDQGGEL